MLNKIKDLYFILQIFTLLYFIFVIAFINILIVYQKKEIAN